MKIQYNSFEQKIEAYKAIDDLAQFLKANGHPENADRLEKNLVPFISSIPVKQQNPCRY